MANRSVEPQSGRHKLTCGGEAAQQFACGGEARGVVGHRPTSTKRLPSTSTETRGSAHDPTRLGRRRAPQRPAPSWATVGRYVNHVQYNTYA